MRTTRVVAGAVAAAATVLLTGCIGLGPAAGTWGSGDDAEPQLELAQGGQVSGTDGCNSLMGQWNQQGDTVHFTRLAQTDMACPDIDVWMTGLNSATLDDDTLHLYDTDGTHLGDLNRAE